MREPSPRRQRIVAPPLRSLAVARTEIPCPARNAQRNRTNSPAATEKVMDRRQCLTHQRELLQLERQAEIAEGERLQTTRTDAELQARGICLLRLQVQDLEPGYGGRLHAVLRSSRGLDLPAHKFTPGDLVAVRGQEQNQVQGIGLVTGLSGTGDSTIAVSITPSSSTSLESFAPSASVSAIRAPPSREDGR